MADVVKQIDILNQIGRMLKAEFKSTVYSDEILEDFITINRAFLLNVYVLISHRQKI